MAAPKAAPKAMNTVITNALEIGLLSEMPCEMPLISTKRKHNATASRRKKTG